MYPRLEYVCHLPEHDRRRYQNKLFYKGNKLQDPYKFAKTKWVDNPKLWPSVQWPDIFDYLVEKTSVYTKEAIRAYKSLDAYNHFVCGHVQTLYFSKFDHGLCFIRGDVLPSQRQGDTADMYDVWVCLETGPDVTGVITANCTCVSGLGCACSHVAAVLFKIEASIRCGINEVASTSEACKWNQIAKSKVTPASLSEIDFNKPKRQEPTKRKKMQSTHGPPKINITSAQWTELHQTAPQAAVFTSLYRDEESETDTASEGEDNVMMPPPLTNLYNFQASSMSQEELSEFCDDVFGELPRRLSDDQCATLERVTRKQRDCEEWYEQRTGRITASNFYQACRMRESTDRARFVRSITNSNSRLVKTPAITWGVTNEETAREVYTKSMQKAHANFTCRYSGLVVNKQFPYLGASPDGRVECTCCGVGALEIKCPFKYRNGLPGSEEMAKDKSYCLTSQNTLKRNHQYFYQVQGQMAVMDVQYCDLVLWSLTNCILTRVHRDDSFIATMVARLKTEFKCHILPELVTHSAFSCLYDDVRRYCSCKRPSFGAMIKCDGKSCRYEWYHYGCVGVKRAPRVKWLCPHCRRLSSSEL